MKETQQLRQKSINELKKELAKARETLIKLRFEKETGVLKKTHLLKTFRKKIARLLSIIQERESEETKKS